MGEPVARVSPTILVENPAWLNAPNCPVTDDGRGPARQSARKPAGHLALPLKAGMAY